MNLNEKKKNKNKNKEYVLVMYFFSFLFLGMLIHFCIFMFFQSESFINSPYNPLQNLFAESVVKGNILSSDGSLLATSVIDEGGNESRYYPYGNAFAHVIGFDSNGKSGLENTENFELLRSHQFFVDRLIAEFSGEKALGDNVVTTLNLNLQQAAYNALGESDGAVIVLEVESGKILSMVSKPDFDPNSIEANWEIISGPDSTALFNRATQGQYAPGSTFKLFTLLEYYRENPDTYQDYSYECTGGITVDNETIHCAGNTAHGTENLKESFANSCNASFSNIGLSLNKTSLTKTCNGLLFNKDLPIDFVSSKSSFTLSDSDSSFVTMSTAMGQGKTLVSPLHLAMVASAVANNGQLMRPYLVDYTSNCDGQVVKSNKAKVYGQLFTQDEVSFLQEYMLEVVNTGTATALGRDGYDVAGKTGTAQVSDTSDQTNSWFVGYATKEGYPTVAIAVVVENSNGGKNAIPVTRQVLNTYFQ